MSGGSYDYLCFRTELSDIAQHERDIEDMRIALVKYGYTDIAEDAEELIKRIVSARIGIESLAQQLSDVFKAVEWYESYDYSKETMVKVLEDYREYKKGMVDICDKRRDS